MSDPSEPRWPLEPDPERDLLLDARSLRAVAHPVRLRILGLLRLEGPSTATRLAAQLGLNSGATSYHLRQLAGYGLIVEDERGNARDRWWRAVHRSTRFDSTTLAEEDVEAGSSFLRAVALVQADTMQRAVEERPTLPEAWQRAGTLSDYVFRLIPAEAAQLVRDLEEVMSRYRAEVGDEKEPVPPGAEPFHVQLQAFLRPGRDVSSQGSDHDRL